MTWLTIHDLRPLLNSPKELYDGSLKALCPFHQDDYMSLHVGPDNGFYCYGCAVRGNLLTLMKQLKSVSGGEYRARVPKRRPSKTGHSQGHTLSTLTMTKEYIYQSEDGSPLYRVIRYTPKDFRQERWSAIINNWIPNMKGVQRVPYKLPEILARPDETIVWVEGEKDADRLHTVGILGTTSSGGVRGWGLCNLSSLDKRRVVVIPDEDQAGVEGGMEQMARIRRVGGYVSLLRLVGNSNNDVTDWLEDHTIDELKELIDAAMDIHS